MSLPTAGMIMWALVGIGAAAFGKTGDAVGTAAVCFTIWAAVDWLADQLNGATPTSKEEGE